MPEQENTNSEQTQTQTTTNSDGAAVATDATTTTAVQQNSDDLSTLFTPEEVTAKKEAATAKVTEDSRRAALTDTQRAEEDATAAEAAKLDTIPEAYEFSIPEGLELNQEILDKITPVFKDAGLTQAKANTLIDVYTKEVLPAFVKQQTEAWTAEVASWAEATKKDPEIGGSKFDATVEKAARALNTINPALKEALDKYGFGNHPEMIRAFSKVADMMSEDSISQAKRTEQSGKSIAERMFPDLPLK